MQRSALRGSSVYARSCGRAARPQPSPLFALRTASRNISDASFPGTRLLVGGASSKHGGLDRRCCRVPEPAKTILTRCSPHPPRADGSRLMAAQGDSIRLRPFNLIRPRGSAASTKPSAHAPERRRGRRNVIGGAQGRTGGSSAARMDRPPTVRKGKLSTMAGGEGFEPPERFHVRRFSRPEQSTTLPPTR